MNATRNRFSPEFRDRAVRMVEEHRRDHPSEWAAMIDSLNRQLAGWAVLQVHRLHGAHIPAHRHCRVLENGALVGAEVPIPHQAFDVQMVPRAGNRPIEDMADLRPKQSGQCRQQGAATTGHQSEDAVPVAEPGAQSLHLQGRTSKHRWTRGVRPR